MPDPGFIHNKNAPSSRDVVAVVLCAGGSTRMGRHKAILPLGGVPLVRRQALAYLPLARVAVVVGAEADAVRAALEGLPVCFVDNPDWSTTWPADSLRLALEALDVTGPCWVVPVDTPPAQPSTLARLTEAGAPAVPVDGHGRRGHPVLLGEAEVRAVRRQAPEAGLRSLLAGATRVPVDDPLVATDFDTPEAWQAYLVRVSRQAPAR